jgi:hypothetical protein
VALCCLLASTSAVCGQEALSAGRAAFERRLRKLLLIRGLIERAGSDFTLTDQGREVLEVSLMKTATKRI